MIKGSTKTSILISDSKESLLPIKDSTDTLFQCMIKGSTETSILISDSKESLLPIKDFISLTVFSNNSMF
jgi:hypothetical protein